MLDLFKTIFKYKEKQSPDKLGLYPETIHTKAFPERRYLWSSRILVILGAISISINIILVSTIYILLPQRSSEALLLEHNPTFSTLSLIPKRERPIAAIDLLNESFIEEYILLRHTITSDYDELMTRWGPQSRIFWMSSNRVYQTFSSNDLNQNIRSFKMTGIVRLVEVEWVRPLTAGFWQAQFITMDFYKNEKKPIVNIWRAYLRTLMAPIPYENRSLRETNPFGFLVTNYSLSYIGTPDDPKSYLNTAKDVRFELHKK